MVLLATFFVAGSLVVSEKLAGLLNPVSLTLLRFLCAGGLLLPIVLSRMSYRRELLRTMPRALVISLFYCLFFICLFESLKLTTVLHTGTLYTLVPFVTALLCVLLFRQRISTRQLLVYVIGVAGTAWVVFNGRVDHLLSFALNQGDYIFMAGAFFMCCYSISMKLLYRNDTMVVLVFCTLVGGSLWMSLALWAFDLPLDWQVLEGASWLHMAYLVVMATLATSYLYQKTTVVLGPSRVMAYIYLNPAAVALLLWVVDGVDIALIVVPGILLSTAATVILQRNPHQ